MPSRFGAIEVTLPPVSRFGAIRLDNEPSTLRDFIGEETASQLTPEAAIEQGHVSDFVRFLEGKLEEFAPDTPERAELAKRIAPLRADVAEFERQQRKAEKQGVSRETILRQESPVGAAERAVAQRAVGQTAMRAEQGLGDIATAGLPRTQRRGASAIQFGKISGTPPIAKQPGKSRRKLKTSTPRLIRRTNEL